MIRLPLSLTNLHNFKAHNIYYIVNGQEVELRDYFSTGSGFYTISEVDALLNTKEPLIDLTINRALISGATGEIAVSTVTNTELSYISGLTSTVQGQLDLKSNTSHQHDISDNLNYNNNNIFNLTIDEVNQLLNINSAVITNINWGILEGTNQQVSSTSSTTFADTVLSNLTANTVLLSDGTKKVISSSITNVKLGYLTDVTSNIQAQLNAKQGTISLTANRALISSTGGDVAVSSVTNTELGYVAGLTSSAQAQITARALLSHSHLIANITGLQNALDLKSNTTHQHDITDILNYNNNNIFNLTIGEVNQLLNINSAVITNANWAILENTNQNVSSTSSVVFGSIVVGATATQQGKLHVRSSTYQDHIVLERHGHAGIHITATNPRGIAISDGSSTMLQITQSDFMVSISDLTIANLTASKVLVSDSNKKLVSSTVSTTELNYLSGLNQSLNTTSSVVFNSVETDDVLSKTGGLDIYSDVAHTRGIEMDALGNYVLLAQTSEQMLNNFGTAGSIAFGKSDNSLATICLAAQHFGEQADYHNGIYFCTRLSSGGGFPRAFNIQYQATPLRIAFNYVSSIPIGDMPWGGTHTELLSIDNVGNLNIPALTADRVVLTDSDNNIISSTISTSEVNFLANLNQYLSTIANVNFRTLTLDNTSVASPAMVIGRKSGQSSIKAGSNHLLLDSESGGGTGSLFLNNYDIGDVFICNGGGDVIIYNGLKVNSLTTSTVAVTDGAKNLISSDITATELSYLDGVTSSIQTQLNGKSPLVHDHVHSHPISDITDLQTQLNGKSPLVHDHVHSHPISDITSLQTTLDQKAVTGDQETFITLAVTNTTLNESSLLVARKGGYSSIRAASDYLLIDSTNGYDLYLNNYVSSNILVGAGGGDLVVSNSARVNDDLLVKTNFEVEGVSIIPGYMSKSHHFLTTALSASGSSTEYDICYIADQQSFYRNVYSQTITTNTTTILPTNNANNKWVSLNGRLGYTVHDTGVKDFNGCVMYIDFSDSDTVNLVSSEITSVDDSSGSGNDVSQGTPSARPDWNTLDGVISSHYDGNDRMVTSGPVLVTSTNVISFTIFMVIGDIQSSSFQTIVCESVGSGEFDFSVNGGKFRCTLRNGAVSTVFDRTFSTSILNQAYYTLGTCRVIKQSATNVTAKFYQNNVLDYTSSSAEWNPQGGSDYLEIGARAGSGFMQNNAHIGCVVIFKDVDLTDYQIDKINKALMIKFGIS